MAGVLPADLVPDGIIVTSGGSATIKALSTVDP